VTTLEVHDVGHFGRIDSNPRGTWVCARHRDKCRNLSYSETGKNGSRMSRIIELSHASPSGRGQSEGLSSFTNLRGMVVQSVGAVPHEVSIPFHDSQVRQIALLIQTGWDQFWGTEEYWKPGPTLADHLIFRCVRSGIRVIGVDFPVGNRINETRLITTGKIPIVENLCGLASLPRIGFRFTAVPLEQSGEAVHAFGEIT
jgi:hypothetical protein